MFEPNFTAVDREDTVTFHTCTLATSWPPVVDLMHTPSSAVDMVEAIHKDQKRVLPCSVLCEGEYGFKDVIVGVPVRIGRGGAEQVVEYELAAEEQTALEASANAVRELCAAVDRLMASG